MWLKKGLQIGNGRLLTAYFLWYLSYNKDNLLPETAGGIRSEKRHNFR